MLFGAFDSTLSTLGFALKAFAEAPAALAKMQQEIDAEFATLKDDKLTFDAVQRLKYLNAAIKESQRLRPVAFAFGRTAAHDVALGDYMLTKGSTAIINTAFIQRSPKLWGADADDFRPERFLTKDRMSDEDGGIFLPFGAGNRECVGKKFAQLEMPIILARIVQHFDIAIDASKPYHEEMTFGIGPRELWLKLTPRQSGGH